MQRRSAPAVTPEQAARVRVLLERIHNSMAELDGLWVTDQYGPLDEVLGGHAYPFTEDFEEVAHKVYQWHAAVTTALNTTA